MAPRLGRRRILVEDDCPVLRVVHAGEGLHEVAQLLPFIVVGFQEVGMVLDGHADGAVGGDFGFGWEGEGGSGGEAYDGCYWGRVSTVLVVAQWACFEDAFGAFEVVDCESTKIEGRLGDVL